MIFPQFSKEHWENNVKNKRKRTHSKYKMEIGRPPTPGVDRGGGIGVKSEHRGSARGGDILKLN